MATRSLRASLGTALLALGCAAGCSAKAPPHGARPHDAPRSVEEGPRLVDHEASVTLAAAAQALVRDGCNAAVRGPAADAIAPVPTWREPTRAATPATSPPFDVVMYTAHPDDEAMYAGGTFDRLVHAGRRVAFVAMSHGEGGRLLERGLDGGVQERRDYPRAHVAAVRDREIANAAARMGVTFAHLYPAEANADDAWTTSCAEAISRWDISLPGGVAEVLRRLVTDLRARRPRVVITLDPRDDPQLSHHGHHKALGVLANAAARLAADPGIDTGGQAHVVEELLTTAPRDVAGDVTVPVDVGARLSALAAYASQFVPEELAVDAIAQRPSERFLLRWRAERAPPPRAGSRLLDLALPPPSPH
jgi:LmbE family N-acetylglucosaminyl deacetylase